jgi:hypothetical protein
MDEATRKAIRTLDELVCERAPGPYLIDAEYARLIEQAESLPGNQDGADKAWVFRAMEEYIEARKRTHPA